MGNGGLQAMMQNPAIRQMVRSACQFYFVCSHEDFIAQAESMQNGGGMPDLSQLGGLMSDPSIRSE